MSITATPLDNGIYTQASKELRINGFGRRISYLSLNRQQILTRQKLDTPNIAFNKQHYSNFIFLEVAKYRLSMRHQLFGQSKTFTIWRHVPH